MLAPAPASTSTRDIVIQALIKGDPIEAIKNAPMSSFVKKLVDFVNIISHDTGTKLWESYQEKFNFEKTVKEISPVLLEISKATITQDRISISTEFGEMYITNENQHGAPGIRVAFSDGTDVFLHGLSLQQLKDKFTKHIIENRELYSEVSAENQSSVDIVVQNHALDNLIKIGSNAFENHEDRIPAHKLPDGGAALTRLALEILKAEPTKHTFAVPIKTTNHDVVISESFFSVGLEDHYTGMHFDIPLAKINEEIAHGALEKLKENIRTDIRNYPEMYSLEVRLSKVFSPSNMELSGQKNQDIKQIVEVVESLQSNFIDEMRQLDQSARGFERKLTDCAFKYADAMPDVNKTHTCIVYDPEQKYVVLRFNDGNREEELKLIDVKSLDKTLLNTIPQYWLGSPPDSALNSTMSSWEQEGIIANSYQQFITDADRLQINGNNSSMLQGKVEESDEVRPAFSLGKEYAKNIDGKDFKKLNAFTSLLSEVDQNFTDEQKDTCFKLLSQDAIPGRGGLGFNMDIINVRCMAGLVVDVTSEQDGKLLLKVDSGLLLKTSDDPPKDIATGSWKTSFLIAKDGKVERLTCEAPKPEFYDDSKLTSKQLFGINAFNKANADIEKAFIKFSLIGIQA